MKYILAVLIIIILIGCSDRNPFDPTVFHDGFNGITYMDQEGNLLGPEDPSDWTFYSRPIESFYLNSAKATYFGDFFGMLPNRFDVYPAFPNPSGGGAVTIRFALPVAIDVVVIKIIDDKGNIIQDYSRHSEAGIIEITWAGEKTDGTMVPPGIYRVIYDLMPDEGILKGYGDIWMQ